MSYLNIAFTGVHYLYIGLQLAYKSWANIYGTERDRSR